MLLFSLLRISNSCKYCYPFLLSCCFSVLCWFWVNDDNNDYKKNLEFSITGEHEKFSDEDSLAKEHLTENKKKQQRKKDRKQSSKSTKIDLKKNKLKL